MQRRVQTNVNVVRVYKLSRDGLLLLYIDDSMLRQASALTGRQRAMKSKCRWRLQLDAMPNPPARFAVSTSQREVSGQLFLTAPFGKAASVC